MLVPDDDSATVLHTSIKQALIWQAAQALSDHGLDAPQGLLGPRTSLSP